MKGYIRKALVFLGCYEVLVKIKSQLNVFSKLSPSDEYDSIISYTPHKPFIDKENPNISAIEINKNCNLNCVMCNTKLSSRDDFNMSSELFESIVVKMVSKGLFRTTLHTIGEPLMNKNLFDYLDILRKHKVKVFLSSNAQMLNKKNAKKIVSYSDVIHTMRFSIDGVDRHVYEKIRINGKFDRLINNLNIFNEINKGKNAIKNVEMNSIVSDETQHSLAKHLIFYSQYMPMENIHLGIVNGLSLDNSYFFEHGIFKKHVRLRRPCSSVNSFMQILNDGSVTPCPRDYNSDLAYGNIKTKSIDELLSSDKLENMLLEQNNNSCAKGSLCDSCYEINPKLDKLFELLTKSLVSKYKNNWDTELVQSKFDRFFLLCENSIISKYDFLSLIK